MKEMASRGPTPVKRGRREDDNDEILHRRKLEKGKELATKDADEEQLFDDTKFTGDLLTSVFRKLEDVGAPFNIKVHHEVDKGLALRIQGLVERLDNLPVVKRVGRHIIFNDGGDGSDRSHGGYDGSDGSHGGDNGRIPTN
jgi:hypothetical protein